MSTCINYYQLVSNCLSLQIDKKSPFRLTLQEKWLFGCHWHRSRTRAHNRDKLSEAEQLLGLFHCNFLFALYQPSCSSSHCKLKSTKVPADHCLEKTRFLVMAQRKQPTLCKTLLNLAKLCETINCKNLQNIVKPCGTVFANVCGNLQKPEPAFNLALSDPCGKTICLNLFAKPCEKYIIASPPPPLGSGRARSSIRLCSLVTPNVFRLFIITIPKPI